MKQTLKVFLKRTIVFSLAVVTIALTFLQPTSAVVNKPKKYLKDVTINEFLADFWLDNIDYYHEDYIISGCRDNIQYFEYNDGYTQILADSILANKALLAEISAWEGITFFDDIGGNTYDILTTTSRYEVILIEMLRQLMKNQDIKDNLSAKGTEVADGLLELFDASLSNMDLSVDDKIDQGKFIEVLNKIQSVVDVVSPWLNMGKTATEIVKLADVQNKCIETWGEVDTEWIIGRIEWLEKNENAFKYSKKVCDAIEAGNFLADQFFIVQDLLEKMGFYFQLCNLNSQYIDYLYVLKNNCTSENEEDLYNAINKVITCISSSTGLYDTLVSDLLLRESAEMIELVWDQLILKTLETACPWIKALGLAYDATIEVLNITFGTSENIESVYTLLAFTEVLRVSQRTCTELRRTYLKKENAENAALFVAGVDTLFTMHMMDCSYAEEYIKDITTNGKLTQFLLSQEAKNDFKEMLDIYKDSKIVREDRFKMLYSDVMDLYGMIWEEQEIIIAENEKEAEETKKRLEELKELLKKWDEEKNDSIQNSIAYPVASGKCGENAYWSLYQDGKLVINGDGNMHNYDSSSSKAPWYDYKSDIKTAIISDGLTSIGNYAFDDCSNLTSITIPDSVTSIGFFAFEACISLPSISIPDSVTSIGDYAFYGCNKFKSVSIPNRVTNIGSHAFDSCPSLASVSVPDSVTNIGIQAFHNTAYYKAPSNWKNGSVLYIGNHLIDAKTNISGNYSIKDGTKTISGSAFSGCRSLESVSVPDSVTSIGDTAFFSCSSLISVTIGDSVMYIGDSAFSACISLKSITIPDSVISIGARTFEDCINLENVIIGKSVTNIENSTFSDCESLTNVNIPDSVLSIGRRAFFDCRNLIKVTIGNGVTSIGERAFEYCFKLASINIPDSVTTISSYAFFECYDLENIYIDTLESWLNINWPDDHSHPLCYGGKLYINGNLATNITIPNSIINIGEYAFYRCSSLTSVTIPDSVTSIGSSAFSGCSSLTSVTIPDSVTSIGYSAFRDCSSLTSVTIPDSVTSIGYSAFSWCSSLTSVTIPDSVTSIGSYAFSSCSSLTSVTIPDSVTSIGSYAFSSCSSLTSVTIPDSVTSIGDYAFHKCSSLANVTFKSKNATIISNAFDNCSKLATIYCYKNSTADEYFNSDTYTKIYIDEENSDSIITGKFGANNDNLTYTLNIDTGLLKITGSGKMDDYGVGIEFSGENYTTAPWGKMPYRGYIKKVEIASGVTNLGSNAFNLCDNLTEVYLPDTVSSVNIAFSNCKNLTKIKVDDNNTVYWDSDGILFNKYNVLIRYPSAKSNTNYTIPEGIKSIYSSAFEGCNNLVGITIPGTVTNIGTSSFFNCTKLKNITIPESVTHIGTVAFNGCGSLTNISIPKSVTNIGDRVFANCVNLESINVDPENTNYCSISGILYNKSKTALLSVPGAVLECNNIPNSVTTIENYAFYDCTNLVNISIPNNVTNIGSDAFFGCSSLTSVIIPDSVTSIGEMAFFSCSNLTSVTFQTKDAVIAPNAFVLCSKLETIYVYKNSTADEFFSDEEYTKIYLDDIQPPKGDSNGDGKTNIKDVVLLAQYFAGWDTEIDEDIADCNGDGEVNIKDLVLLAQYLAGWNVTLG